jgi:hypothetical protein
VRFVCSCISLNEPLSLLWETQFYHNKIILLLVFPPGFSPGVSAKKY